MLNFERRLYDVAEGEELVVYSEKAIKTVLEEDITRILVEKGIPRFWSPDVDFICEERGAFQLLSDFINSDGDEIKKDKYDKCKNYIVFAMHNNSFIALNEKKEVVMMDYEQASETYVHQDIKTFIYGLVIFNELVLKIIEEFPDCDYFGEYVREEDVENFKNDILKIDKKAIEQGTFWDMVLEELME